MGFPVRSPPGPAALDGSCAPSSVRPPQGSLKRWGGSNHSSRLLPPFGQLNGPALRGWHRTQALAATPVQPTCRGPQADSHTPALGSAGLFREERQQRLRALWGPAVPRPRELPQVGAELAVRPPRPAWSMPETRTQPGSSSNAEDLFTPLRWRTPTRHVTRASRARLGGGVARRRRRARGGHRRQPRPRGPSTLSSLGVRRQKHAPSTQLQRGKNEDSHQLASSFSDPRAWPHMLFVFWKKGFCSSSMLLNLEKKIENTSLPKASKQRSTRE